MNKDFLFAKLYDPPNASNASRLLLTLPTITEVLKNFLYTKKIGNLKGVLRNLCGMKLVLKKISFS